MIPVPLLRPDNDAIDALKKWSEEASGGDREIAWDIYREAADSLRPRFVKFSIPFLSLPSTTSNEIALKVFIQMNTSASKLSAYDIVVAQVETADTSLHELTDQLRQEVPTLAEFIEPSDLMMAVTALLQNKVPSNSTYLAKGFGDHLIGVWDATVHGIRGAVRFLEEEKLFDGKRLPSDVVLYPLAALWSGVHGLDSEGRARNILRKYIWRAFCTDRYERTSATRALTDYRQLSAHLKGEQTAIDIFDDDKHPLPTIEQIKIAGWPVRKDRLARAILAVSLRSGGLDFADGSQLSRENIKKREYHHLFPNAWLAKADFQNDMIFRALNCGLVSWQTNRTISDKSPSIYLDERMDRASLGESEIRKRLDSHLIPLAPIKAESYEAFLDERSTLVRTRMIERCQ
ncbi:hypothetical protein BH24ACI3_BH24ACI3_13810 [soil metagenome]